MAAFDRAVIGLHGAKYVLPRRSVDTLVITVRDF